MNEQKTIILMLTALCIVLLFAIIFLFAANLNMQRTIVQINNKAYYLKQGMINYASDNNFDMNGYFELNNINKREYDFNVERILNKWIDKNA